MVWVVAVASVRWVGSEIVVEISVDRLGFVGLEFETEMGKKAPKARKEGKGTIRWDTKAHSDHQKSVEKEKDRLEGNKSTLGERKQAQNQRP